MVLLRKIKAEQLLFQRMKDQEVAAYRSAIERAI